jgi:hypothetical protein
MIMTLEEEVISLTQSNSLQDAPGQRNKVRDIPLHLLNSLEEEHKSC